MVISRTPFRVSFFGGGTDYPVWYRQNGGAVIATSINKYCYVTCRYLPPFFKYNYRIRYTKQEYTKRIDQIKHPSVRESLKYLNFESGIEMQHNADLPAMAGLGSSSAFTVGFLHCLYALVGETPDKKQLALDAIHVEQKMIREEVGSQDQTTVSFGGFNKIIFGGRDKIIVVPINIEDKKLRELEGRLMLFFTGISRFSSYIAKTQIRVIKSHLKNKELFKMHKMVDEAAKILSSKNSLDDFGRLLDEAWKLKRGLTKKISNGVIDAIYESAKGAGAIGGKLLGAGGGGFMLFYVKPEDQQKVSEALKKLLYVPFRFENYGSQIIYKMPDDVYR